MKKYLSVIFFALVALLTRSQAFAVVDVKTSGMVEAKTEVATDATEKKDGSMAEGKVEYALPYPGILPDHPLYFLKSIRDQILERLIADPSRKIEFYILQGDKKLNAGIFLGLKDKQAVASETFVQAEIYMKRAVQAASAFKTQGRELPAYIAERLHNSLSKHEQELSELLQKAAEAQKGNVTSALTQVKKLQEEVTALQ